jgi:hypothetical protein
VCLEISDSHEEGSIIFIQETNSLGFSGVGRPIGISVCVRADPFAMTPRVANFDNFCAIAQYVL